jgi:hypothetical protein
MRRNLLPPPARTTLFAGLFATLLLGPAALAGEALAERFQKTYDLEGVTKVRLQNVNGPVRIGTWDRAHLRLEAVKKAKGRSAEKAIKETEIRIGKQGHVIEIETILPKHDKLFGIFSFGESRGAEVTYDLQLPPDTVVEIETVNGRIVAEHRSASLSLNTVNGSVRVEAHDGPLHVNTVNGSVDVEFAGPLRVSDLETVNGSVTVACSKESSIEYALQTVNGRIRSDFAGLTVEGKWGPKEARGTFNGGRDRLSVETVNGEVRLLIAEAQEKPKPH